MQTIKNVVAKILTARNFCDFRSTPLLETWIQRFDDEPSFYDAWLNSAGFTVRLGKLEIVVSFMALVGPSRIEA
jgi:hypothetical protein